MCRFTFYKGKPLLLSALLTEPEHSLIHQSVGDDRVDIGVLASAMTTTNSEHFFALLCDDLERAGGEPGSRAAFRRTIAPGVRMSA